MPPPKRPPDANAVQPSKRERGRVAQREYRKRHASKFQSLQDENQRLKDVIRNISKVASRDKHQGRELNDAISEAVLAADLQDADQGPDGEMNSSESGEVVLLADPTLNLEMPSEQPASPNQLAIGTNALYSGSNISQTLGQQVWLGSDHLVRIYDAPSDVAPYLGDGLFTIAGCLYWACTYYAVSLWKKLKHPDKLDHLEQGRWDRLFNHSKYLFDHDFLISLAQARLELRQNGYIDQVHLQTHHADNKALLNVYKNVEQEYANRGETLQWWRKPQDVENYIKQHLTAHELAQLQEILEGRGSARSLRAFGNLFESLAHSFVCFGDGPRWNVIHVSMALGAWLGNRDQWWGSS
ncbi:hypothetical protein B0J13DRAFT_554560 [Dactylonectria estremocensis]|uniref:BZIP domain-containing protein n=1 Tax=Dactylonectria estremocensis TaxID=1079267 RepID=A0A9P9J205_9HYPO|nr:hypothetical protein B0J13DRAFT_554560 [Dactylonectria estremocensis]